MKAMFEHIPINTVFTTPVSTFIKISNEFPTVDQFFNGTAEMNAESMDEEKYQVSFNRTDMVELNDTTR